MLKDPQTESDYKIINQRINEEIKEVYTVNAAFLVANTILFAFRTDAPSIVEIVGLAISIAWFFTLMTQVRFKRQWIQRALELEDEHTGMWNKHKDDTGNGVITLLLSVVVIIFIGLWVYLLWMPK